MEEVSVLELVRLSFRVVLTDVFQGTYYILSASRSVWRLTALSSIIILLSFLIWYVIIYVSTSIIIGNKILLNTPFEYLPIAFIPVLYLAESLIWTRKADFFARNALTRAGNSFRKHELPAKLFEEARMSSRIPQLSADTLLKSSARIRDAAIEAGLSNKAFAEKRWLERNIGPDGKPSTWLAATNRGLSKLLDK